jgi:hypothetical protein
VVFLTLSRGREMWLRFLFWFLLGGA